MITIHKSLPSGAVKAKYESEFFRLKHRKKVMYADNRELRFGLRYLIWSRYGRCYYERVLKPEDDPEDIRYYQAWGWLYLFPTEENKEEIKEDMQKSGIGYYELMRKRQAEIDHERHHTESNRGDGYKFKERQFRKIRYNK